MWAHSRVGWHGAMRNIARELRHSVSLTSLSEKVIMPIEMKNKFEYFLTNLSKKFIEEQNKNNEIELSDYFELNEILAKKNIEDLSSLLYYYVRFYEKNINNLSIESYFSYLDF